MKPLSTLRQPLRSVDVATGAAVSAAVQRSDVCAAPAASVVAEAVVALVLADALLEKTGGDSLDEVRRNLAAYHAACSGLVEDSGGDADARGGGLAGASGTRVGEAATGSAGDS